jgi:enoyl-[acyl-carrier protein] reductase I
MKSGGLLSGRRGLILGVSSENSAGYACAAAAIEQGASVAITHRPHRRERVSALAARLGAEHVELEATDETSMREAFAQVPVLLGGLDFLVHTLVHVPEGVLSRPATALTAGEFQATMEVGVRSLLAACRFAEPLLERSSSPRVVALSSGGGESAMPSYHAVGIAKAALSAAVRYLALELGPRGILCNVVSFSLVETDAAIAAVGQDAAEATRRHLAKRSMTRANTTLADVGGAVAYFASPLLRNVTGETLTIDGGFSRAYF